MLDSLHILIILGERSKKQRTPDVFLPKPGGWFFKKDQKNYCLNSLLKPAALLVFQGKSCFLKQCGVEKDRGSQPGKALSLARLVQQRWNEQICGAGSEVQEGKVEKQLRINVMVQHPLKSNLVKARL